MDIDKVIENAGCIHDTTELRKALERVKTIYIVQSGFLYDQGGDYLEAVFSDIEKCREYVKKRYQGTGICKKKTIMDYFTVTETVINDENTGLKYQWITFNGTDWKKSEIGIIHY